MRTSEGESKISGQNIPQASTPIGGGLRYSTFPFGDLRHRPSATCLHCFCFSKRPLVMSTENTIPQPELTAPAVKPTEVSFTLPKAFHTTAHVHLNFLGHCAMVFLATSSPAESGGSIKPMGSFVYAMPDVSKQIRHPTTSPIHLPACFIPRLSARSNLTLSPDRFKVHCWCVIISWISMYFHSTALDLIALRALAHGSSLIFKFGRIDTRRLQRRWNFHLRPHHK